MKKFAFILTFILIVLTSVGVLATLVTQVYDDFEDGSINSTLWGTTTQDAGTTVSENNGTMNISAGTGYTHTGGGFYTKNNFTKSDTYVVEFNWSYNWSSTEVGHSGVFFMNKGCYDGTYDCRDTATYGVPVGHSVFIGLGAGCANYNNIGIFADDASTDWHCGWEQTIFTNSTSRFVSGTVYNIKIEFDFNNRIVDVYVDNVLAANGTIPQTHVDALGDEFKIEYFLSHYPYLSTPQVDRYNYMNISKDTFACNQVDIGSNTTLSSDWTNNTCFNIISNNVTFDCGNHILQGSNDNGYYAINAEGKENITIKNCVIRQYGWGIGMNDTNNLLFQNITLFNLSHKSDPNVDGRGIYLYNVNNLMITGINASSISSNSSDSLTCYTGNLRIITIDLSSNITIKDSNLSDISGQYYGDTDSEVLGCQGGYRNIGQGVYATNSSNITLNNIRVNNINSEAVLMGYDSPYGNLTRSYIGSGNWVSFSDADNFLVTYNTFNQSRITTSGTDLGNYEIKHNSFVTSYLSIGSRNSLSHLVYNNTFSGVPSASHIKTDDSNGNISSNIIDSGSYTGTAGNGILVYNSANNVTIDRNTIRNTNFTGNESSTIPRTAIFLYGKPATVTNNVIDNVSRGIGVFNVNTVEMINNTIKNTYENFDIVNFGVQNWTLTNVSYNKSKSFFGVAGSSYYNNVRWYFFANVTNTTGDAINGSTVSATDLFSNSNSGITGANGLTGAITLTEFNETNTGKTYFTPHSIQASKTGYLTNSTNVTVDRSFIYNIILESAANETEGRNAIVEGINNVTPSATVYTDLEVDIRYLNGTQLRGSFDKVAFLNNQRWGFNYVTGSESFTNMLSSFNVFNVWENQTLTYSQIVSQVSTYINQTKI